MRSCAVAAGACARAFWFCQQAMARQYNQNELNVCVYRATTALANRQEAGPKTLQRATSRQFDRFQVESLVTWQMGLLCDVIP